ncbi:hypothetical protein ABZY05_44640 [Streptomyces canus]|uniref:hypothetical protein n=1 Tax=Streptomyces canus TaxID=58343 RepID=UPI0033A9FC05
MTIALEHHTPQTFIDLYAADPAETAWPTAAGQDMDSSTPATNTAWPSTPH